ncbi:MSHA biogenesis protein MshI [Parashewanella spongiae]|uniref:MSHA biogenesis protein MshI n=2 Tax=Parashewanella spongiae TaxID=342950 RepID=A0A3A6TH26_9GAMM|nr:MSHA biogenesis protein MshI [Parashewanella spongiae]RJY15117.1 MSHA biogenesis protein MshI [Parashewanella spongiae]
MRQSLSRRLIFWAKSKRSKSIGIYVAKASLWLHTKNDNSDNTQSSKSFEIPFTDNDWDKAFSVIASHFSNAQLFITLGVGRYQLIQTDKPQVPDSEMTQALQWSIKDLVNLPPANVHLDYFHSPVDNSGKINVVALEHNEMKRLAIAAKKSGLTIRGVSIEELVLSNMPPLGSSTHSQSRLIICHQSGGDLLLAVIKNNELHLQRRVRGFHALNAMSKDDLTYGGAENISLEIQRSMDFYESQLRQAPIHAIDILVENVAEHLVPLLGKNFSQPINIVTHSNVSEFLATLAFAEMQREAKS